MKVKLKFLSSIIHILIIIAVIVIFYETVKDTIFTSKDTEYNISVINVEEQQVNEEEKKVNRVDLVNEILKYNYKVAYKELGRCYTKELPIIQELEFDVNVESYQGIDGLGFIDWCYRYATGTALDNVEFPFTLYDTSEKVLSLKDLKIGDIGYGNLDSEIRNVFGIFIGYYEKVPVFATCRYSPFENMEWGGLQVAYLKSEKNELLDKAEPVDLKYFIRPNVEWLESDDTVSLIMSKQGLKVGEQ